MARYVLFSLKSESPHAGDHYIFNGEAPVILMDDLIFYVVLGVIQGILEWLPVSSSGNVTLLLVHGTHIPFSEAVKVSFFLHAGTMFSVLVKFRSDFWRLTATVLSLQRTLFMDFYIVATAASAVVGVPLYLLLKVEIPERGASVLIALFIVVTGIVIRKQKKGLKSIEDTSLYDAVLVGVAQGIAVIPGISRSGMTVSTLLARGITQREALHLSFLLSVPPVVGLMILGFSGFHWIYLVSLGASFVCSLLSMEILLKAAQKLDFSWFCFAVAFVTVCFVIVFY
jgi:undecaprenyl-diphosphatase